MVGACNDPRVTICKNMTESHKQQTLNTKYKNARPYGTFWGKLYAGNIQVKIHQVWPSCFREVDVNGCTHDDRQLVITIAHFKRFVPK